MDGARIVIPTEPHQQNQGINKSGFRIVPIFLHGNVEMARANSRGRYNNAIRKY